MLDKALQFLEDQLNQALSEPGQPEIVVLTSLVSEKGDLNIQSGQLAFSLVSVEEEKILKTQLPRELRNGDQIRFAHPEIQLNLLVMLAAYSKADNYVTALGALSRAITFFQGTPFFEKKKFAALGPEIEKLTLELITLSFEQQNQLWGSLGAKYLPSAVYKVRLVVMDRQLFGVENPAIKVIDNDLQRIN